LAKWDALKEKLR